ncbi:MBL fold metallo-hydrolase [Sphingomicrobium flavum]|uniref:MBL fold metallo-hydrolase n=1 Tax=Sphingomicrobium flavum TaxID=1229164 RepID=UPI0021ADDA0C|nr:MBL fold metallo-hydrolase [Sphingomicrobium flavum]
MLLTALALAAATPQNCPVELIVLGAGQDAGAPQIGNNEDPAWDDPEKRLLATSIAFVNRESGDRYLFEATPDIVEQLRMLDEIAPVPADDTLGLEVIFLTHAHMGHYAGLMHLGVEAANTRSVDVAVMPRLKEYLTNNGPWSQLVTKNNIGFSPIELRPDGNINAYGYGGPPHDFIVIPFAVPHRDEYSETVAYLIIAAGKQVLFVPDIDSFEGWKPLGDLAGLIGLVDYAFLDSTFFDDNELDRDMSAIPHPRTKATMERLAHLPADQRAKVHFIHYNHSNPIRFADSPESKMVVDAGFNVARRGDRHCLTD